ncbi:remorin isoform X2 [Gossypium australe]|uniref:Remorin isoform X2 n=1 Tax=Gossypium australe TaxID=47621 RepID=A0A5B6VI60_9ROSI|nr:remorin isoform X2 [Gossypium australe]
MGEQEADKMAAASEPKVVQQPVLVSMDDVAEDKSLIPPISQRKMGKEGGRSEEKRAVIEAKKAEDFLKITETAAKFRGIGYTPKKFLGCFSSSLVDIVILLYIKFYV